MTAPTTGMHSAAQLVRAMRNVLERVARADDPCEHSIVQAAGQLIKHPLYADLDTYISSFDKLLLKEKKARLDAERNHLVAEERVKSAEALVLLASRSPKRVDKADDSLRKKLATLRDHLDDFFDAESIGVNASPHPALFARRQRAPAPSPLDSLLPAVSLDGVTARNHRIPHVEDPFIAEEDEYISTSNEDEDTDVEYDDDDEYEHEEYQICRTQLDGGIRRSTDYHAPEHTIPNPAVSIGSASQIERAPDYHSGLPTDQQLLFLDYSSDAEDEPERERRVDAPTIEIDQPSRTDMATVVHVLADDDEVETLVAEDDEDLSASRDQQPSDIDDPDYTQDSASSSSSSKDSDEPHSIGAVAISESSEYSSDTSSVSSVPTISTKSSKRKRVSPQLSPEQDMGDWRRWNSPRKTSIQRPATVILDQPTPRPRAPSPRVTVRRAFAIPQMPIPDIYTRPHWRVTAKDPSSSSAPSSSTSSTFPALQRSKLGSGRPPTPQVSSARRGSAAEISAFNPTSIFSWRRMSGV